MRIALIGHKLHGGGAEYVTRIWCAGLLSRGHNVDLITTDPGDVAATWVPDGATVQNLSIDGSRNHLAKVRRLRAVLKVQRYDVVLAIQTYPALVTLAACYQLKSRPGVVISERNVPSILLRREGLSEKLQLLLAKFCYRLGDGVIAISHPVAADLVSSFALQPAKVYVIPNPASEKVPNQPRKKQSESKITLVMPSRLSPQKQPLLAVEVAVELCSRGWDVETVFFGAGEMEGDVQVACSEHNVKATFKGWNEDWTGLIGTSGVVLLPSFCEGFGNVLVEAATASIPSVALSKALGVADALVPGITGELAYRDDSRAIADAVERARRIRIHRISSWLENFSAENSVNLLEHLLLETSQHQND